MAEYNPWMLPMSLGQTLAEATAQAERRDEKLKQLKINAKAADTLFKANPELQKQLGVTQEEWDVTSPLEKIGAMSGAITRMTLVQQERDWKLKQAEELSRQVQAQQTMAYNQSLMDVNRAKLAETKDRDTAFNRYQTEFIELGATPEAAGKAAITSGWAKYAERLPELWMTETGKSERATDQFTLPEGYEPGPINIGPGGITRQFNRIVEPPKVDLSPGEVVKSRTVNAKGETSTTLGPPEPPTLDQTNARMFHERMAKQEEMLADLEQKGFDPTAIKAGIQEWLPNLLRAEDKQRYTAAKDNWIAAVLRKESGAAISKKEYDDADKQYFPQVGDSPAVVKQKAAVRALVQESMFKAGYPKGKNEGAATGVPAAADVAAAKPVANPNADVVMWTVDGRPKVVKASEVDAATQYPYNLLRTKPSLQETNTIKALQTAPLPTKPKGGAYIPREEFLAGQGDEGAFGVPPSGGSSLPPARFDTPDLRPPIEDPAYWLPLIKRMSPEEVLRNPGARAALFAMSPDPFEGTVLGEERPLPPLTSVPGMTEDQRWQAFLGSYQAANPFAR